MGAAAGSLSSKLSKELPKILSPVNPDLAVESERPRGKSQKPLQKDQQVPEGRKSQAGRFKPGRVGKGSSGGLKMYQKHQEL